MLKPIKTVVSSIKFCYWIFLLALLSNTLYVHAQESKLTKPLAERSAHAKSDLMVRIAEIEIIPEYLEAYKEILKVEAAASVKLEPGVIVIFPMYEKEHPTRVRILEIYADKAAYDTHLKTPHFLHYKTETMKMVKSLKLVEMAGVDTETMLEIFKKSR